MLSVEGRSDRRNETVASPGHRLDAAFCCAVAVENLAQRRDLDGQIIRFDSDAGPDLPHNGIFRHQDAWLP